jgi:hypothetical protein
LRLMSTPNHRRHFGALGATASGIKVSSGGRELLPGIDSGTTLSLGGLAFLEQKLKNSTETLGFSDFHKPGQLCGIQMPYHL